MILIPAIDLRGGNCVRLFQGDFAAETRYDADPLELANHYQTLGATWLHVVDLDGARDGTPANHGIIQRIARETPLKLQIGGGIRTRDTIDRLLALGASRLVIGSLAIEQSVLVKSWLSELGPERICLALDVRLNNGGTPVVQTRGWRHDSALNLWSALDPYAGSGLKHVLCTDIARDGALTGPNVPLYADAVRRCPELAWQASGGIRSAEDLRALDAAGALAAVSGKALLERKITAEGLIPFLPNASSPASTSATARS